MNNSIKIGYSFYWYTHARCKNSPLHNQLPAKIFKVTLKELEELTKIKKKLVI
jgi:uncharacterized protein YcfL